jgi:hypothetical protein
MEDHARPLVVGRSRRRTFLLPLLALVAACADSTGPARSPVGAWQLVSIDGAPLPAIAAEFWEHEPTNSAFVIVSSGILVVDRDTRGRYDERYEVFAVRVGQDTTSRGGGSLLAYLGLDARLKMTCEASCTAIGPPPGSLQVVQGRWRGDTLEYPFPRLAWDNTWRPRSHRFVRMP